MTLTSLAFTYVLGGLTFIPLLLALVLIPAWYLLPTVDPGDDVKEIAGKHDIIDDLAASSSVNRKDAEFAGEGAASGTFAVLRSYHFQSALSALNAKTGNAASTNGPAEIVPDSAGESVYQSMYRSVFDRNKNANTTNALLEQEEATSEGSAKAKRKTVPTSILYIVLRHGHLMLYDSASQMEVRHVISLAHHSISLSDGEDDSPIMDADLFIKRTAIVLTPNITPDGVLGSRPARSKPFYLFSMLCSEKEDFYQALLTTRPVPPIPQLIAPEAAIKLQSTLHSNSLTPETRAFNAIIGRIFLSLHRTPFLETFVRTKIENKIARVQKPAFIAALSVQSIDLGDAAPVLSNPRLRDLNISGDLTLSLDLRYSGGVKVVIAALAKIDLGSRFKTRTIELVLATSIQRLSGHILVRIKPPPANRIWFTFESMPEMDIKVEPVVSQRQITYAIILRAIEERIRGVIAETLVKPNWDDVPFFDTRMQHVRGGIWKTEGKEVEGDIELENSGTKMGDISKEKNEKTMSMPALPLEVTSTSTTPSGSDKIALSATLRSRNQANELKHRSVASLPGTASMKAATTAFETEPPRPLRSPSFTIPSVPVVALNGANVASVRADDAALKPGTRRWVPRPSQPISNWRDAVEGLKEMRDREAARDTGESLLGHSPRGSISSIGVHELDQAPRGGSNASARDLDLASKDDMGISSSDGATSSSVSAVPGSAFHMKRTDTATSAATSASSSSSLGNSTHGQQQRGKNILAATAAATNAARNWSWNVITKRGSLDTGKGVTQNAQSRPKGTSKSPILTGQPIGRGQPLPPPGQPLPGPRQIGKSGGGGLWGTNTGSINRKPVTRTPLGGDQTNGQVPKLPPRPKPSSNGSEESGDEQSQEISLNNSDTNASAGIMPGHNNVIEGADLLREADVFEEMEPSKGDEFGPWRQNSGTLREEEASSLRADLGMLADGVNRNQINDKVLLADGDSQMFPDDLVPAKGRHLETNKRVPPPLPSQSQQHPHMADDSFHEDNIATNDASIATLSRSEIEAQSILDAARDVVSDIGMGSTHEHHVNSQLESQSQPHAQNMSTDAAVNILDVGEVNTNEMTLQDFESATIKTGLPDDALEPGMEARHETEPYDQDSKNEVPSQLMSDKHARDLTSEHGPQFAQNQGSEEDLPGHSITEKIAHCAAGDLTQSVQRGEDTDGYTTEESITTVVDEDERHNWRSPTQLQKENMERSPKTVVSPLSKT
nr:putative ph domain-containing protein [Quercus suber]